MYPTLASPATAVTVAAMLSDEAIAEAQRRHLAHEARQARHVTNRRTARRAAGSTKPRLRVAATAIGAALALALGLAVSGSAPSDASDTGSHAPTAARVYP